MNHQTRSATTTRRVCALLALLLAPFPLGAQLRDLHVLTDAKAEFYQGRQRMNLSLQEGDVVEGEAHPTYRGWLQVTLGEQAYDTRAKYFRSRAESREGYARQRADLISRIDRNTERIDSAREQVWQLQSAIAAIRFDSTVQYREEVLVPIVAIPPPNDATPPPGGRPGERHPKPPRPTYRVEYRYVDKISPSRAKNQARHWQDDVDSLLAQVAKWTADRRDDLVLLASAEATNQALERRFRLFETNRASQVAEPHLVVSDKAQLYDGQVPVAELQQGEVVLARANDRFSRWLRVQTAAQALDGRREHFAARSAVEAEAAGRVARLRQSAADLEADLDLLSGQEKQLRSLCLSLRYESQLTHFPLTTYPFAADYAGRTFYAGGATPRNTVQMVSAITARSVLRDWEKDLTALQEQLKKLRQRLDAARRDAAVTEAKAQEQSRRLQSIDPAEQLVPSSFQP